MIVQGFFALPLSSFDSLLELSRLQVLRGVGQEFEDWSSLTFQLWKTRERTHFFTFLLKIKSKNVFQLLLLLLPLIFEKQSQRFDWLKFCLLLIHRVQRKKWRSTDLKCLSQSKSGFSRQKTKKVMKVWISVKSSIWFSLLLFLSFIVCPVNSRRTWIVGQ